MDGEHLKRSVALTEKKYPMFLSVHPASRLSAAGVVVGESGTRSRPSRRSTSARIFLQISILQSDTHSQHARRSADTFFVIYHLVCGFKATHGFLRPRLQTDSSAQVLRLLVRICSGFDLSIVASCLHPLWISSLYM